MLAIECGELLLFVFHANERFYTFVGKHFCPRATSRQQGQGTHGSWATKPNEQVQIQFLVNLNGFITFFQKHKRF